MSRVIAPTPGPWKVENLYIIPDGGQLGAGEIIGDCGNVTWKKRPCSEHFANARLMAAAPELRDALQRFLDMYISCVNSGDWGDWDPETDSEVIQARRALEKSTARR